MMDTTPQQSVPADVDFDEFLNQDGDAQESVASPQTNDFTDNRLSQMQKQLPSWSLEPPHSFLD